MADADKKNIIIKKVIGGGHGGHHGGAWKVAYADFVTAMMAFFLLLWLLSSVPQESLKQIAQYFTPTVGLKDAQGIGFEGGISPTDAGIGRSDQGYQSIITGGLNTSQNYQKPDDQSFFDSESALNKMIETDADLKAFSHQISVDMTPEGLRIRIVDDQKQPMFSPNTAILMPYTKLILKKIVPVLKYLPNYIMISGHTSHNNAQTDAGLWELSSQRANATKQFMVDEAAMDAEQVGQLRAMANRIPFDPKNLRDPRNVRIEIIILKHSIMPYNKPML
jgi:chemotaxis protein MotB